MSLFFVTALTLASPAPGDVKAPEGTCVVSGTFTVTDDKGKAFQPDHAEVYVADSPLLKRGSARNRDMLQQGIAFVPHILVVERDDTVVFKNKDNVAHEIHAYEDKNTFMVGATQKPESTRVFQDVGETHLGCHKHPSMSATILTVPNVFHTKVAADGTWSIPGLPRGPLKLVFWERTGMKSLESQVTVKVCDKASVDVTIKAGSVVRAPLRYKDGGTRD